SGHHLVSELLYGAGLLTAITAAPDILMQIRLNEYLVSSVTYSFPGMWFTVVRAMIFTALAMSPMVVMLPEWLTSIRFLNLLPPAPWILLCCLKFLKHILMHLFTIGHMAQHDDASGLIMALIIYCIIFALSIEMMLHW
ncbi:hypothetical protein KR038_006161, partial [Drosophila bunnanda]